MTITLNPAPDMEAYLWERDAADGGDVSLAEHGIGPAQAAELRARFATFARNGSA